MNKKAVPREAIGRSGGFTPIIILLVVAVLLLSTFFVITKISPTITPISTPEIVSQATLIPTITPTPTPTIKPTSTPKPTTKPTVKPTATATPQPAATNSPSCNYDLSSSTGSLKIVIQPQTGYMYTGFYGTVKATSGCKVLDGGSTDSLRAFGSANMKEVIFNIPPGHYDASAEVNGNSTGSQGIDVASGQLSTVNFTIPGDPVN